MDTLPLEVLSHLLSFLDAPSVCAAARCCRLLCDAVADDSLWERLVHRDFPLLSLRVGEATYRALYAKLYDCSAFLQSEPVKSVALLEPSTTSGMRALCLEIGDDDTVYAGYQNGVVRAFRKWRGAASTADVESPPGKNSISGWVRRVVMWNSRLVACGHGEGFLCALDTRTLERVSANEARFPASLYDCCPLTSTRAAVGGAVCATPLHLVDDRLQLVESLAFGTGVWSIACNPASSERMLLGCTDNAAYEYDLEQKRAVCRYAGHSDFVRICRYIDASVFATCSFDQSVAVWDRRSAKAEYVVRGTKASHYLYGMDADRMRIAIGSADSNCYVIDQRMRRVVNVASNRSEVNWVLLSDDYMLACDDTGTVLAHRPATDAEGVHLDAALEQLGNFKEVVDVAWRGVAC